MQGRLCAVAGGLLRRLRQFYALCFMQAGCVAGWASHALHAHVRARKHARVRASACPMRVRRWAGTHCAWHQHRLQGGLRSSSAGRVPVGLCPFVCAPQEEQGSSGGRGGRGCCSSPSWRGRCCGGPEPPGRSGGPPRWSAHGPQQHPLLQRGRQRRPRTQQQQQRRTSRRCGLPRAGSSRHSSPWCCYGREWRERPCCCCRQGGRG